MRAGGFAEERVIELINRRFVPFYYEVSGHGCAASPDATEFVGKKTRNPWAFLAAFAPDGEYLGETALYGDKDQVFEFLRSLLVRHPEFAEPAADERALLAALGGSQVDTVTGLAAGELLVELGQYPAARRAFQHLLAVKPEAKVATRAAIEMARLARYDRDWDGAREYADLAQQVVAQATLDYSDRIALERGYYALAHGEHAEARRVLETAIDDWPQSRWLGEIRFYAGVACFFAGEGDRAKFHWVWVCENIPDDRLYQRCYFSATFDQNPYPNPELGRNDMDFVLNPSGSYSPANTAAAFAAAKKVYEKLADSQR